MKYIQFDSIFSNGQWVTPGIVGIDDHGKIVYVGKNLDQSFLVEKIPGWAIPGFINGHSHAFQYAMTGITEYLPKAGVHDDFWSWRETMYQLALAMEPDEIEKIATMLYAEMLRHGYTSVVEFHYLHHDPLGKPYQNPSEISLRLIAAAQKAGIQLILVPVLYQLGDFFTEAKPRQRRFIFKEMDNYFKLLETLEKYRLSNAADPSNFSLGLGIHSLRAVAGEIAEKVFSLPIGGPRHMHLAEQRKEVETCQNALGMSPTRWVLEHLDVDSQYYFTHCTHSTPSEIEELTQRQAHVVLCPSTEGNLGDGFFPLGSLLRASPKNGVRGGFLIGTDSHIGLNPLEELRWLDYTQRLLGEKRNPLCQNAQDESALILLAALARSRTYSGDSNNLSIGDSLDCIVLKKDHPIFVGKDRARTLSVLVYCGDPSVYAGIMRRGQWIVVEGRHLKYDEILSEYKVGMKSLFSRVEDEF